MIVDIEHNLCTYIICINIVYIYICLYTMNGHTMNVYAMESVSDPDPKW